MSEYKEGRKDDQEKIRLDLIPKSLLYAVGSILTFGAKKYEARNWEKGIKWGRVFAALMRHMWSWWSGENTDPETGKSHLWHAGCCLTFLIEYETTHPELDDRPKVAAKGQGFGREPSGARYCGNCWVQYRDGQDHICRGKHFPPEKEKAPEGASDATGEF